MQFANNVKTFFIDKCMAVMAMIMRGNNESMLRKQFDWLLLPNVSANQNTRRSYDTTLPHCLQIDQWMTSSWKNIYLYFGAFQIVLDRGIEFSKCEVCYGGLCHGGNVASFMMSRIHVTVRVLFTTLFTDRPLSPDYKMYLMNSFQVDKTVLWKQKILSTSSNCQLRGAW